MEKTGKLELDGLERVVFTRTGAPRREVVLGPRSGEDSAALDFGGDLVVVTMDPITGAGVGAGGLAVHVCCNDLAATGAEPVAVMLTLLLPVGSGEDEVAALMESAHRAALQLGVAIVGGHTEFTPGLPAAVVCAAGVGRARRLVPSGGARPGDELVLIGAAGIEGTAILAHDFAAVLEPRLGAERLAEAQAYAERVSVVRAALLAAEHGATALHDVTEGGVLGAAYEMARAAGTGLVVDARLVPVSEVTVAICELARIDPLRLISSGSLLAAAPADTRLAARLNAEGVPAAVIGRFGGGLLQLADGHPLGPPAADQLWAARSRLAALAGGCPDCGRPEKV